MCPVLILTLFKRFLLQAVTFATIITGKTAVKKGLAYIAIQMLSSILATLTLMIVFPDVRIPSPTGSGTIVGTYRDIPEVVVVTPMAKTANAFFMELILV